MLRKGSGASGEPSDSEQPSHIKICIKITQGQRILDRWQSRKQWEFISPPRQQLHWQNLSDITILEL